MRTLYPMDSVQLVEKSWEIPTIVTVRTPLRLLDHTKHHRRVRPSAKDATGREVWTLLIAGVVAAIYLLSGTFWKATWQWLLPDLS